MSKIKISVACCTYNGERFILEQLQSIAEQTRMPDEVIICDDGSSDNTIPIIKSFATKAPYSIKIFENNEKPLRSTKNFEKAIKLCAGEVIFLSDQDDVWLPTKVEVLARAIEGGAGLVFSDATLVDENLKPLGYSLFDSLHLSKKELYEISQKHFFNVLVRRNIVTGAGTAFAKKHIELFIPISDSWVHDGWIAILISKVDNIEIFTEQLFKYRQHSKNQIGARRLTFQQKISLTNNLGNTHYLTTLNGFIDLKNHILSFNNENHEKIIKLLEGKIEHLKVRSNVTNPKLSTVFILFKELMLGRYHNFSRGWISLFRDIAMLLLNLISKFNHPK